MYGAELYFDSAPCYSSIQVSMKEVAKILKKQWVLIGFGWASLGVFTSSAHPTILTINVPEVCKQALDTSMLNALKKLQAFTRNQHASWPSQYLKQDSFPTVDAEDFALTRILTNADIKTETIAAMSRLATSDPKASALWNMYFRSYDQAMLYSGGFHELYALVQHYIPASAKTIADVGVGTANFSALLANLRPHASLEMIDFSDSGLAMARAKIIELNGVGSDSAHQFIQQDLRNVSELPKTPLDAAVINNVLYNFNRDEKKAILKWLFDRLPSKGVIVVGDPKQEVLTDPRNKVKFSRDVLRSAVQNKSPANDFDIALIVYINQVITGQSAEFLNVEQYSLLFTEIGFRILGVGSSYHDASNVFVLEKP